MQATRHLLPGGRWHLQHGPIDIVIGADGEPEALQAAHEAAWQRFGDVLPALVAELPLLRQPVRGPCPLRGTVARRMWCACRPFHDEYVTPMAAVAGAVAQELIAHYQREGVVRAWVNNGGDIALHLAAGESLRVGLFADLARLDARQLRQGLALDGRFTIDAAMSVRGIATSGWRGRSFSLGVADSVTVLARHAAEADAAATMIANSVNVDAPALIERRPASTLKDDTDLGDIPVTVDVQPLPPALRQAALRAGLKRAQDLQARGLIVGAALVCQGELLHTPLPQHLADAEPALA
ncbi:UPF0280 family protein [Aquabacterium sp.]|uniref:UPF0280 family protein n=1 Tax=Aquabacterium sp. TaxID=1872578 RepID=UPI0037833A0E